MGFVSRDFVLVDDLVGEKILVGSEASARCLVGKAVMLVPFVSDQPIATLSSLFGRRQYDASS